MESNRNLSSIISKIRDDGPPGDGAPAVPGACPDPTPAEAAEQPRGPAGAVLHRTSRNLLSGLVLLLIVVVGTVYFAGSYTGQRYDDWFSGLASTVKGWSIPTQGSAREAAVTGEGVSATSATDAQAIHELTARQLDIVARLDQLTDAVTALGETANKNWMDNSKAIADLRQAQHTRLEALEAKVKVLQPRLASEPGKPTAAVSSPAVKPVLQAKAGNAARAPATRDTPGQAVTGEEWVVNVASSSHEEPILDVAEKLKEKGISTERQTLTIEGELMYRLRVPGFATSGEARRYARKLEADFGFRGPWISRK